MNHKKSGHVDTDFSCGLRPAEAARLVDVKCVALQL